MPLINPFFRLPGRWSRRRARKIRMALQLLALAILLLVLLPAYVVYKPPKSVISYLQSRNPSVLFQIQTSRKIVALYSRDLGNFEGERRYGHVLCDRKPGPR
jgi:hypothetical protein